MRNKGAVVFLTIIITLLCIYYLSFTFVARGIQQDAIKFATSETGVIDLQKKQAYLDSIYNLPVYNLFGAEYTYKEVKDTELSLGLDLQGGMQVTLEVSPVDIIKGLSGNSQDADFQKALEMAKVKQKTSQTRFGELFHQSYQEVTDKPLAGIFATAANRGRISRSDSDQAVMDIINKEIEDAIERSFIILRTRIDQFGTSQPNIQRLPGTGRIQIEIPGADNPERVRKLLQGVAKLEFWEVAELNEINNSLMAINDMLVKEQQAARKLKGSDLKTEVESEQGVPQDQEEDLADALSGEDSEVDTTDGDLDAALGSDAADGDRLDSLMNDNVSPLFALTKAGGGLVYDVRDTAVIGKILRRSEVRSLLSRTVKPLWDVKPTVNEQTGEELLQLYFVRTGRGGNAKLTGEVITDARQDLDQFSRPAVSMQMNALGTRVWAKMTADAANQTPKGRIAIVLDNLIYSAPYVNGEIPNGSSQISGNFTIEEAKDLANILKAGSLPAPTRIVEEAIVGPTLGKVAQNQGIISIVSGLVVVVLFMVAYYAKGGIVANIALVFNIFFILGILAQFNASLTLPGIAGIVLTIGMSIDANVLIFERIREELRNGVKLRAAVTDGYKKAFSSIVDANVTTFLTAVILYVLGQGPVKGFAITLMIGIACSFFTAVYITRVIVEWMVRKGDETKVSFSTPFSSNLLSNLNIDFMGRRRMAYMISGIVIVIGLALVAIQGLNMGVDFKGGRSYIVNFQNPVVATDMKLALGKVFEGAGTEVKNYDGNNNIKVTTSYMVDDESDTADDEVKNALISGIESFTGQKYVSTASQMGAEHFTISGSSKVGATIADDIKTASMEAGIFSVVVIFLYILIRFRKWQFSTGAIVAVVHDTLFVFSAFAIAGLLGINFEIDQVFVAALLTIIGYSINDTVVVFDRIREYLNLGTSSDKIKIFNSAINTTLNRTMMTSLTTMIVVLILFIFGGEVLRGFSFALLIGILVGTYSSIFIASPVVIDLDKKKPISESEKKKAVVA
ncbi:Protein-export membrane protein SecD [Fulvivirga imtechensis AK7]|uniref:Multifunctional fusion protein n=1 Tax=Fulvivirga imtechensis AK7 TaxID=1237149 RepID=L8JUF1_9BACT|nr:protein translocase subunit SecDF [Fulvivirga imtechensis]ELR70917.1 Protein-export membrane protein SecD [Fulvivirga imtechensis AK7]